MRTIHADLISAQKSGAADPYIYIHINSTDYSSRLISLEHREEPYREWARIILANSDRHFNDTDLRGCSFFIGYGYETDSGTRYCGDGSGSEATPTLWVKSQSMVSMEGELVCVLDCEGGWTKLREYNYIVATDEPPYINYTFKSTETVCQIIEKALELAGFTISYESYDDIIANYCPLMTVNPNDFETPYSIIRRLLNMTKCFLRQQESSDFEIVYPQDTDSVNETFYSSQAPYFKEYVEKSNLLIPNSIVVFANLIDEEGNWDTSNMITGTAKDQDSIDAYGEVIEYFIFPYIPSQGNADDRAEAILVRYKAETFAGRLILPYHDCRVELYDRVEIFDTRGT